MGGFHALAVFLAVLHLVEGGRDISTAAIGPCRLLINGMNCTPKGYFETVQCDSKACFCVQPNNGEIAIETRTESPRVGPRCSECYNRLAELYKDGQPPVDSYLPLCDNKKGLFQRTQCTADRTVCFCVDPDTGKEVPGSKKKVSEGMAKCDDSNYGNGNLLPAVSRGIDLIPIANAACKLPMDRGSRCSGRYPVVEWHFDPETFTCLAFEYLGCQGNENRFGSSTECRSACLFADTMGCAGMNPAARGPLGKPLVCGKPFVPHLPELLSRVLPPLPEAIPCPPGYRCVIGSSHGFCCPQDKQDLYDRSMQPRCHRYGREPAKSDAVQVLLGKNCSSNFCPSWAQCEQNDLFAYCC
ncbi:unnamed protein product, partial [Mesorhabditis spiculigera]